MPLPKPRQAFSDPSLKIFTVTSGPFAFAGSASKGFVFQIDCTTEWFKELVVFIGDRTNVFPEIYSYDTTHGDHVFELIKNIYKTPGLRDALETTKHTLTRVEMFFLNDDKSRNTIGYSLLKKIQEAFEGYIRGYIMKIADYETFDDWMTSQKITTVSAFDHQGNEHYGPPQSSKQKQKQNSMLVEDFDDVDSHFIVPHQQGRTFVPNKPGGGTAARSGYVNTGRVVVCGDPIKSRTIFQKGKSMYYKAKDHNGKFQYVRVKVKI